MTRRFRLPSASTTWTLIGSRRRRCRHGIIPSSTRLFNNNNFNSVAIQNQELSFLSTRMQYVGAASAFGLSFMMSNLIVPTKTVHSQSNTKFFDSFDHSYPLGIIEAAAATTTEEPTILSPQISSPPLSSLQAWFECFQTDEHAQSQAISESPITSTTSSKAFFPTLKSRLVQRSSNCNTNIQQMKVISN